MNIPHSLREDRMVVRGVICKDPPITNYFFRNMCDKLLRDIQFRIFNGHIEIDELINELYLYLSYKDWYRLRQFNYQSKLTTWVDRVAHRFFLKQQLALSTIKSPLTFAPAYETDGSRSFLTIEEKMDVEATVEHMSNTRYQEVIRLLFLKDMDPEEVAETMGVSLANFYNLKRRACVMFQLTYKKLAEPNLPESHYTSEEAILPPGRTAPADNGMEDMDAHKVLGSMPRSASRESFRGMVYHRHAPEVADDFDETFEDDWSMLECLNYDGDIPTL